MAKTNEAEIITYQCPLCDEEFLYRNQLKIHITQIACPIFKITMMKKGYDPISKKFKPK